MPQQTPIAWPRKLDLFGAKISATDYTEAEDLIIQAARARLSAVVTHLPVYGVTAVIRDRNLRRMVNRFDIVAPDGQPVRWALNRLYGARLADRVYGPELMLRLCRRSVTEGVGIYLVGGTPRVVMALRSRLMQECPGLYVAGYESPPFRALTPSEDQALVERINGSGAGLVFIGLGCPKQDVFAHEHRGRIRAVQLCVGAAFDFHAGAKKMAPPWMQDHGLEWLFRLFQEPRRLGRRYFEANTLFLALMARRLLLGR